MEGCVKPAWLERLMAEESFFAGCGLHQQRRKNEKNIFCLLCCQSFCPHCLPSHQSHPLLQPYTINSAKVIFLNQRAQSRSCKGSANSCFTCDRILQVPFSFCSLSCKVDFMVYHNQDLSSIVYKFDASDIPASQFERLRMDGDADGQITPNSILEDPLDYKNSSSCTNNDMGISAISHASETTNRKKKGGGFLPGIMLSLSNRRKGAPSRSPLS
ncbi:uncharacterized protein LOC116033578 isoform X2 [Ipomoea triloba]|uniref:uncharacterized protein LOC116033578 isoform X2 n=1 Tax=Ipomoea triloba TaxID=35885 RepID=UPI00125E2A1D|nr:uncharacterized protein LOC116033578 isoform X2 [Ipomoea triloba]